MILCLVLLCLISPLATSETPKPLLVVAGDGAMQNVFLNFGARYPFYYRTRSVLTGDQLGQAGVIAMTQGGAIRDVQGADLTGWVKGGGRLIVVGDFQPWLELLRPLLGPKVEIRPAPPMELEAEEHLLLNGGEEDDPFDEEVRGLLNWSSIPFSKMLAGPEGGESLLHAGECSAVWLKTIGEGSVLYLARELFPPFPMKGDHWSFAVKTHDAFLTNLLTYLRVPTMAEAASTAAGPPVAWYREPPPGLLEGGRTLFPPIPASPDERLTALRVLAGRNEHERRAFFTTVAFAPEGARATVGPLRGPQSTIPTAGVKVGYQGRPEPDYRGPLCFIRWLQPGETIANPGPVVTWWLDVYTGQSRPGKYRGEIRFEFDKQSLTLPVEVEIDPARIPRRRPFHFSAEFCVTHLERSWRDSWPAHWQELGIDFFTGGQLLSPELDPVVRQDGRRLSEHAREARRPLADQLPLLDFSNSATGRWDRVMDECLRRRLTIFRTYYYGGVPLTKFTSLSKQLYRREDLTDSSPEVRATAGAVMREYGRFLREKGFRNYYSKCMDEWPSLYLENYLAYSKTLHEAGWGNVANPDVMSVLANRVARERVWPYVDLYWIEGRAAFWYDLQRISPIRPNPKGMRRGFMSFYTGSYWWDRGYLDGPRKGWASAWRRHIGFHLHGWGLRGKYSADNVYLLKDMTEVCPAMNLVMMAEGMDDAQYGVVFQDLLDHLRAEAVTRADAERLTGEWNALVGESPESRLRVKGEVIATEGVTRGDFIQARRDLFRMLAEAHRAVRRLKIAPTLRWGPFRIVTEGKPTATLLHDSDSAEAASEFAARVKAETGVGLSVVRLPADAPDRRELSNCIVFVNTRSGGFASVSKTLNGGINRRYPAEGTYAIFEDEPGNLWVAAGTAEVQTLGVMNLLRASELLPMWFDPALWGDAE